PRRAPLRTDPRAPTPPARAAGRRGRRGAPRAARPARARGPRGARWRPGAPADRDGRGGSRAHHLPGAGGPAARREQRDGGGDDGPPAAATIATRGASVGWGRIVGRRDARARLVAHGGRRAVVDRRAPIEARRLPAAVRRAVARRPGGRHDGVTVAFGLLDEHALAVLAAGVARRAVVDRRARGRARVAALRAGVGAARLGRRRAGAALLDVAAADGQLPALAQAGRALDGRVVARVGRAAADALAWPARAVARAAAGARRADVLPADAHRGLQVAGLAEPVARRVAAD